MSCSCAAGCTGPRPQRSRWATSGGGMAGGALWKGRGRRHGRRVAGGLLAPPLAPEARAWSPLRAAGALAPDEDPPAFGRGDAQRVAGAGAGRRASGCAEAPAMLLGYGRAGPRPRRSRWAASSGEMAGGASWTGHAAGARRRIGCGQSSRTSSARRSGVVIASSGGRARGR
jgi:hypothetical protein